MSPPMASNANTILLGGETLASSERRLLCRQHMKNRTSAPNGSASALMTAQSLLGACLFVATVFACANLIGCGTRFESHSKLMTEPGVAQPMSQNLKPMSVTDKALNDLSVWRFYDRVPGSTPRLNSIAISTDGRLQSKLTILGCSYHIVSRAASKAAANGVTELTVVEGSTELVSFTKVGDEACLAGMTAIDFESRAYGKILKLDDNVVTITVLDPSGKTPGQATVFSRTIPVELDAQQNCESAASNCLR